MGKLTNTQMEVPPVCPQKLHPMRSGHRPGQVSEWQVALHLLGSQHQKLTAAGDDAAGVDCTAEGPRRRSFPSSRDSEEADGPPSR